MYALFDNCNTLHTNAYDEALTTPTEESVRRAVAIQLIINRELGLNKNQNPWQGSFAIEELTDLVEEAVYKEFESHRGARRRARRHGDDVPARQDPGREPALRDAQARRLAAHRRREHVPRRARRRTSTRAAPLFRASRRGAARAGGRGARVPGAPRGRGARGACAACSRSRPSGGNVFAELLETVQVCSLGQITRALYEVGGQYRRHM